MIEQIRKAREGDPDAFIQLMDAHKQAMYQVARGYFSNPMDVEDVLSETVLTCWERLGTLRRPEFFKTWLIRILINNCNDLIRSRRRLVPLDGIPEPAETIREDDLPACWISWISWSGRPGSFSSCTTVRGTRPVRSPKCWACPTAL